MLRSVLLVASSMVCAGAIALCGCANGNAADGNATTEPAQPGPGDEMSFAGLAQRIVGDWSLAALRGVPVDELPTEGVRDMPSLRIEPDGRASGAAGVNRWFSSIDLGQLAAGNLSFAPAGSTMMAGPDEAMALERDYLSAIRTVRRIDPAPLASGELRLLDADGEEVLRFTRDR